MNNEALELFKQAISEAVSSKIDEIVKEYDDSVYREALAVLNNLPPIKYRDTTLQKMFEEKALQVSDLTFKIDNIFYVIFKRDADCNIEFEGVYAVDKEKELGT